MSTETGDDWMNKYDGAGNTKPAPVDIVKTDNFLSSVTCDLTNYPEVPKLLSVPVFYEAYFTGNVDSASLAYDVRSMNAKLVAYLASSSNLCDTKTCDSSAVSCVTLMTKPVLGVEVDSFNIQEQYLCEQPKPNADKFRTGTQFNRVACVPISTTLNIVYPNASGITESTVKSVVSQLLQQSSNDPNLLTESDQIIGLVPTTAASKTINQTGVVEKQMRPVGIGLLTAGCIVLFLMILGGLFCWCRKRMRDGDDESFEDEDDDLSLEKDKDDEESNVLTVSYMSDDSTPVKGSKK